MFKILKIELKKLRYSKLLLAGVGVILFSCILVSVLEFHNIEFGKELSPYTEFMLYNTSFVITKFFLPAIIILLTASVWGGEYANGMIKNFMLCNCKKRDFFINKILFLIICSILAIVILFLCLSLVYIFKKGNHGIEIGELIKLIKVYSGMVAGILPMILITTMASVFFTDFQKNFSCGLVILLVSLSIDSIEKRSFLTPTHFLGNGELLYYAKEKTISFVILGIYIAVLYVIAQISFLKKDIWS